MNAPLLPATPLLLIIILALLLFFIRKVSKADSPALGSRLDSFETIQERTERPVREEITRTREELSNAAREQRQELIFKRFGESVMQRMTDVSDVQKGRLTVFFDQLVTLAQASGQRLDGVRAESALGAKQLREEVSQC